jgi:hypothetical protein
MRAPVMAAALASGLALWGAAGAQTAAVPVSPAPADPIPELSELVVVAHPQGPALWRVRRGDSTLIILGAVSPLPQQLRWNERPVIAALDGARLLLTPPKPDLGPMQVLGLITTNVWKVRQGQALEPSLPAPLRARFVAARTHAWQPPSRYAHWKPAVAGFLLLSDYRRSWGFSEAKPGSTVENLAKDMHIPQKQIASYRIGLLMKVAARLDDAQNLACLADTLDQMEFEGAHPQDLDDDWARGDIRAVAARYRAAPLQRCLLRAPGAQALIDAELAKAGDRLWDELGKPGKTVAVIDLAWLMPQGGLLDRLKARGAQIDAPPALAEPS